MRAAGINKTSTPRKAFALILILILLAGCHSIGSYRQGTYSQRNVLNFLGSANMGKTDRVEDYLSKGMDPNATNDRGTTAMMSAAWWGQSEVIWILLKYEAEINAMDHEGQTALHYATLPVGTKLLDARQAKIAELLIANGAELNIKNKIGYTPLITAIIQDHMHTARTLIKNGADVNIQTPKGWTPLMFAAWLGRTSTIDSLLNRGSAVDAKSENGATALMFAAQAGHRDIVEILLAKGAEVNTKTDKGGTALMFAMAKGHTDIVELLKKRETMTDSPSTQ